MNFDLGEDIETFRQEVRKFIQEHLTAELVQRAWTSGTLHDWDLHRKMAERHWIAPAWPTSLGGAGLDEFQLFAFHREFLRAGAPIDGLRTTMLVLDTLRRIGTDEQIERVARPVLAGEMLICLGYSEPGSGSDVAAAATKADRDGAEWVINGQKMFTTLAHESSYVFLLTRTDSNVPKHRGLTMFLVPMDSAGVEVTPVRTLGGQRTNITFYGDVRVPDSARVGDVHGAWEVMKIGLALERTVAQGPGPVLDRVERWAQSALDESGAPVLDSEQVRMQLARTRISAEVVDLLNLRTAWASSEGRVPAIEGSMAKLFGAESYNRHSDELLECFGPAGLRSWPDPVGVANGELEHAFRYAPFCAIAGGANEIQRSIIAERHLGLPRTR